VKMLAVLVPFLLFGGETLLANQAEVDVCVGKLPAEAAVLLSSRFPSWHVKRLEDFGAEDQKLWQSRRPGQCPGVVPAHLQFRSQFSYAVLLVPNSMDRPGLRVVVLYRTAGPPAFRALLLLKDDKSRPSRQGLVKMPSGTYCGFENLHCVTLGLEAFNLEALEDGILLYYFRGGRFRTLQTSD